MLVRSCLVAHALVILDTLGGALRLDDEEATEAWQGIAAGNKELWLRYGVSDSDAGAAKDALTHGRSAASHSPSPVNPYHQRVPIQSRLQSGVTAATVAAFVVKAIADSRLHTADTGALHAGAGTPASLVHAMVGDAGIGIQRAQGDSSHSALRSKAVGSMLAVVRAGAALAASSLTAEAGAPGRHSEPGHHKPGHHRDFYDSMWATLQAKAQVPGPDSAARGGQWPEDDDGNDSEISSDSRLGQEQRWQVERSVHAAGVPIFPAAHAAARRSHRRLAHTCARIATACLGSSTLSIAALAADTLVLAVSALKGSPVLLLPQLASSWAPIAGLAARGQHYELRIRGLCSLADGLCRRAAGGDFLRSRVREQLWPLLVQSLAEGSARLPKSMDPQADTWDRRSTRLPQLILDALWMGKDTTGPLSAGSRSSVSDTVDSLRRQVRSSGAPGAVRLALEAALCIALLCMPSYRHADRGYAGPDADANEQDGLDENGDERTAQIMPVAAAMQRR